MAETPSPLNVVVLGAGPAGLCAAWNLVRDGHNVVVLEKENAWGGMAQTVKDGGFSFDIGPHNIHSRHRSVLDFLAGSLKDQWIERKIWAQIYFRKRRIEYPLVGLQVLRFLPWLTSLMCALDFALRRAGSVFIRSFKDDGSYRTWVINRFGKKFYDIFFGPYTQKTWKITPEELSDYVAKKRVAVKSIIELIRSIFFKTESHHLENPRLVRQAYTKKGVGEICDFFARGILERGGKIVTSAELCETRIEGRQCVGISYLENGQRKDMDFTRTGDTVDWQVISTVPINRLFKSMKGRVPEEVRCSAEQLDFTAEVFLFLKLNTEKAFEVPIFYFSETEFPFNRVYDVRMFSPDMVPDGKNGICLEWTCREGDEIWNMPPEQVFEKCMRPLESHGLLHRDKVEGYFVKRLAHAYPLFRVGFQGRVKKLYDFLYTMDNLTSFGRQGLFTYANVDDVIWMAFEIAKQLPYQKRMRLHLEELLPLYVNF